MVRLELGTDSVLIKLCPWTLPYFRLCGTGDVGFVSSNRYEANGELKLTNYLSLTGTGERIQYGLDTAQDVVSRLRFQLTLKAPIY